MVSRSSLPEGSPSRQQRSDQGRKRPTEAARPRLDFDALEVARDTMRLRARSASRLVSDDDDKHPSLSAAVARSGYGWRPLAAVTGFLVADQMATFVLQMMAPEISRALGISATMMALIVASKVAAAAGISLQIAAGLQHRYRPMALAFVIAVTLAGAVIAAAFVTNKWWLLVVLAQAGPSSGAAYVLHRPLVVEYCPPEARIRALSFYQAGAAVGAIIGAALVASLSVAAGLTWRGVFVVVGGVAALLALVGARLGEPRPGRFDHEPLRDAVRAATPDGSSANSNAPVERLGYFQTMRRLWAIETFRWLLVAWAVLGVVISPLVTYLFFLLQARWNYDLAGRCWFFLCAWAFAPPVLAWFGRRGDRTARRDPARLLHVGSWILVALAGGLIVAAISPGPALALVGFGTVFAAASATFACLFGVAFAIVRPHARPHAAALICFFLLVVGAQGGSVVLGGLQQHHGAGIAIAVLSVPTLIAAWTVRRGATSALSDLHAALDEVIEEEHIALVAPSARLPLLACRHLEFAYGSQQVLFDVNLSIDEGEMVALLGTNGAGKSTLLRAISGLGLPTRGTILYGGRNITYCDTDQRVAMGITQIAGGRAVFPTLSVADNLRVFGYSLQSRAGLESRIAEVLDTFPQLVERRDQPAGVLSGGEQQMLALGKAFLLRPKLLLIDELSLGLAPVVVTSLLDMVRRINAGGTAVVLVEQSVNVALSVVEHAYFMEKGEIRFDGRATDLLAHDELLRAVFLRGAADSRPVVDAPYP